MITLKYGSDARAVLLDGMKKLHDAVASSMGPSGRNMYFEERDNGYLTKDGATIARYIAGAGLLDKFQRAGAAILRRASSKTEEDAGDGTTAATVLAYALSILGKEYVDKGCNVLSIDRGMRRAYEEVVKCIDALKKPADTRDMWEKVAYISSRDREVAAMIADAMEQVGAKGHIRIDTGDDWVDHEMKLEVKRGMTFPRGYGTETAINNRRDLVCSLKNAPILITDMKLYDERQATLLSKVAEAVYRNGSKEMVIMGNLFSGRVMDFVLQNNIPYHQSRGEKGMLILPVECPGYGSSFTDEFADDIAVLTGSNLISEKKGRRLEMVDLEDVGRCMSIESGKKETHIVGLDENKDAVDQRAAEIVAMYEHATGELDKRRYEERIASLTTGMAVITVGGRNTDNIGEKKARVEDAKLAAKSAFDGGIVPGGGCTFLKAADALAKIEKPEDADELAGIEIVRSALRSPIERIAHNCFIDRAEVSAMASKLKDGEAINMSRGTAEKVNAIEQGIVDPALVLKSALMNAIETAVVFLTTETVGVQLLEDAQKRPIFECLSGDAATVTRGGTAGDGESTGCNSRAKR